VVVPSICTAPYGQWTREFSSLAALSSTENCSVLAGNLYERVADGLGGCFPQTEVGVSPILERAGRGFGSIEAPPMAPDSGKFQGLRESNAARVLLNDAKYDEEDPGVAS
jgi:hypothetical protein